MTPRDFFLFVGSMYENSSILPKTILVWNENLPAPLVWKDGWPDGKSVFIKEKCLINSCTLTSNTSDYSHSDLVLFRNQFRNPPEKERPRNQIWLMYTLESPLHTPFVDDKDLIDWTATYRTDSTIVAPYRKWHYYVENIKELPLKKNYASSITKSVAWFVSNCHASNGRMKYAKELAKYIDVDIYGSCGTKTCHKNSAKECFKMLQIEYRFYLAFENSNCKEYITEKFFFTGLGNDVIPIVMGARPEDYKRAAPLNSFIHVDDFEGPNELAQYLKMLEQNDELYNHYFLWKGTGEFIDTKFFCRLCAVLHDPRSKKHIGSIKDFNARWNPDGTCIYGSWGKALTQNVSHATNNPHVIPLILH